MNSSDIPQEPPAKTSRAGKTSARKTARKKKASRKAQTPPKTPSPDSPDEPVSTANSNPARSEKPDPAPTTAAEPKLDSAKSDSDSAKSDSQPAKSESKPGSPERDHEKKERSSQNSDQSKRGPRPKRHTRQPRSGDKRNDRGPRSDHSDGDSGNDQRSRRNQRQPRKPLPPLDIEEWSVKAWQIFASEIQEDSVKMFNDRQGQDLADRSFKLAEIFMRNQMRRHYSRPVPEIGSPATNFESPDEESAAAVDSEE